MHSFLAAIGCFALGLAGVEAASPWQVSKAKTRYLLSLDKKPTHAECGYFGLLPDGGILGGRPPVPQVMTPDGKTLQSRLLWNNTVRGFEVVFEDPGSSVSMVEVYMLDSGKQEYWTPDSGLKPSAILCARPGVDSIEEARSLAKLGKVPDNVTADPHYPMEGAVPFSIGGDLRGRPMPGVFYFLTHVVAPSSGKYWIAPFQQNGQTITVINGQELKPEKTSKVWGGNGAHIELEKGLNRVEVFQTAPGTGPYSTKRSGKSGLMFLTWKPPGATIKRASPGTQGTVKAESRNIGDDEIARSGLASLASIERMDGAPVASAEIEPKLLFWFEGEDALSVCALKAQTSTNPPDTQYTWIFPDKSTAQGPEIDWVFPGFTDASVTLVAKSAKGVSKVTFPVSTACYVGADMNVLADRSAFLDAAKTMLGAAGGVQPDPLVGWSPTFWNMLFRTLEPPHDTEFLESLFKLHTSALSRKLTASQIGWLQDRLIAPLIASDPDAALKWVEFFKTTFRDPARSSELKLKEAEIVLHAKSDFPKATAILTPLSAGKTPFAGKALVRLGDIALLQGKLNEATSYYAQAQGLAKSLRNAASADPTSGLVYDQALNEVTPAEKESSQSSSTGLAARVREAQDRAGQRKSGALQEVSLSENVRTLMKGGYLPEAAEALEAWETEFPLSKISGDYILRESEWHMRSKNPGRAYPMLAAYCRQVDASSFLPDAVSQLIECSQALPTTKPMTTEIVKGVLGRLKYHPVAPKLEAYLKNP